MDGDKMFFCVLMMVFGCPLFTVFGPRRAVDSVINYGNRDFCGKSSKPVVRDEKHRLIFVCVCDREKDEDKGRSISFLRLLF